ncbi:PmoA family protein [Streptomyces sp. N2-109]|uniref:PmoA family protein n=1 Tax=Streptomyces gossypii TaxID=2883101 RepID=A0ABT2JV01_9ACTN|nr:PmoA family protein [Streptomyces gossypii]MCT2591661.1 PmoA family protein [Streptomyces gossypii]
MNSALLSCAGRPVARYGFGSDQAARPYFHPVTTLAGTPVTEERPGDHLHHLGASVAVPDVAGHNFWGGNTFVRDQGPTALDNHGTQRHIGWKLRGPDGFVEELCWQADGAELLREHRTVAVTELSGTAWALDFSFALTNRSGADLTIGSPATNGRPGAGYGGFFWRAPKEAAGPTVFSGSLDGEEAVHGSVADWLALSGDGWTLVFAGATAETRRDPWFVRGTEYPGVGSSLAAAQRLPVPAETTVVRRVVTVIADGRLDRDAAAALVRQAVPV